MMIPREGGVGWEDSSKACEFSIQNWLTLLISKEESPLKFTKVMVQAPVLPAFMYMLKFMHRGNSLKFKKNTSSYKQMPVGALIQTQLYEGGLVINITGRQGKDKGRYCSVSEWDEERKRETISDFKMYVHFIMYSASGLSCEVADFGSGLGRTGLMLSLHCF